MLQVFLSPYLLLGQLSIHSTNSKHIAISTQRKNVGKFKNLMQRSDIIGDVIITFQM
jgi:hypothetical protein